MKQHSRDDYVLFPEIKDREKAGRLIDVAMINLLKEAKALPKLIYSYLKCGFIVTKWNKRKFTKNELKEWIKAVEEYRNGERHPDDCTLAWNV